MQYCWWKFLVSLSLHQWTYAARYLIRHRSRHSCFNKTDSQFSRSVLQTRPGIHVINNERQLGMDDGNQLLIITNIELIDCVFRQTSYENIVSNNEKWWCRDEIWIDLKFWAILPLKRNCQTYQQAMILFILIYSSCQISSFATMW